MKGAVELQSYGRCYNSTTDLRQSSQLSIETDNTAGTANELWFESLTQQSNEGQGLEIIGNFTLSFSNRNTVFQETSDSPITRTVFITFAILFFVASFLLSCKENEYLDL